MPGIEAEKYRLSLSAEGPLFRYVTQRKGAAVARASAPASVRRLPGGESLVEIDFRERDAAPVFFT